MTIKRGQTWEPILGGTPIVIVKPHKTDKYWNTRKINGSPSSHRIHEGTLKKFYKLVTESKVIENG